MLCSLLAMVAHRVSLWGPGGIWLGFEGFLRDCDAPSANLGKILDEARCRRLAWHSEDSKSARGCLLGSLSR